MKTKENNMVRVSRGNQPDPVEIIRQLNETLNAVEMQKATLRFKALENGDSTEFLDSFYGVGYILNEITNINEQVKNYFLETAKLVVGIADGKESCWISFCGWYILADGMYLIRMTQIKYSDYDAVEEVYAREFYERHFAKKDSATEKDFRLKMS